MIGQTISHYKILEKLGEGGMGVVYKAEDTKLKRTVALKFLPKGLEAHEPERARFLQEAQAASALNHPNICAIHALGEHEGQQFIDMEFVDGKTLRELKPETLKLETILSYAIQIGEALQEAHSKGIVHRDVKCENIMVNSKNQIKVMDFGLAKLKGSLKLTKTSSTVGTLAYMAPEQIQGGETDSRSDIFSFGVVLFEMLTGRMPFRGEHEAAMMYSILNEEPEPIQKYRPDLSSEMVHILNRALEKDPEERYQSVHDMVIDLRRVKKQSTRIVRSSAMPVHPSVLHSSETASEDASVTNVSEQKSRRRSILWASIAGGLIVLLAAIVVFVILPRKTPRLNPNMVVRTLELPFREIGIPGISRDGNWTAFNARDAKGEWSLYFMNIAKGTPVPLAKTVPCPGVNYAEISPDMSEIICVEHSFEGAGMEHVITLFQSSGGAKRQIAKGAACRWQPSGERIGFTRDGQFREFWTIKSDGSDERMEFADSLGRLNGMYCFDWSPDGTSIAWARDFDGYEEIFIRELTSGRERQITFDKKRIAEFTWASNDQIFFSGNKGGNSNIWMISASGGEAIQVTRSALADAGVRISSDGKRLVCQEMSKINHLWVSDIDGRNTRQLTFEDCQMMHPDVSSDGKQIVFEVASADYARMGTQIYRMNIDGTNRVPITNESENQVFPNLSPDNKWITYAAYGLNEPLDSSRVYLIEAQNPSKRRILGQGLVGWWADTDKVVVNSYFGQKKSSLYSLRENKVISVNEDSTYKFSYPNAAWSLVCDQRKDPETWWIEARQKNGEVGPRNLIWSGQVFLSRNLNFMMVRDENGKTWRISLPDGKRERLPEFMDKFNPSDYNFTMSRDGKKIYYLEDQSATKLVLMENVFE